LTVTPSPAKRARRARKGDPLTDREVQILSLVAAGERTAAISDRLGIAQNTVKAHLTHIYTKTGCTNRVQAARYYLREYTVEHGAGATGTDAIGGDALIRQQIREIQTRMQQVTPAAAELGRLQQALDALSALERR
jgi:DNA-binding CsgD family transcriptional regulator